MEAAPTSSGDSEITNKIKKRTKDKPDIGFTKALDNELPNIFAAPKNPKTLLFPANRAICSNKLPEDCHYRPESLVKLFLLPDVLVMSIALEIFLLNDLYFLRGNDLLFVITVGPLFL